jgi:hypothetical protein
MLPLRALNGAAGQLIAPAEPRPGRDSRSCRMLARQRRSREKATVSGCCSKARGKLVITPSSVRAAAKPRQSRANLELDCGRVTRRGRSIDGARPRPRKPLDSSSFARPGCRLTRKRAGGELICALRLASRGRSKRISS